MSGTQSLTLPTPIPSADEWDRLKEICSVVVRSRLISCKSVDEALAIALKGRELRIPPMQAWAKLSVINGKIAMEAELMTALIYRDIPGAKIEYLETTDKVCRLRFTRPGEAPSEWSFTIEQAKTAGLLGKGPWKQYPDAMLRARCISAMARAKAADALMGCSYIPEELGSEKGPLDSDYLEVEAKTIEPAKSLIETSQKTVSSEPYLIRLPDVPQKSGGSKPHILNGKTIQQAYEEINKATKRSLLRDSYEYYRQFNFPPDNVTEFLKQAEAFYKEQDEIDGRKDPTA